MRGLPEVERDVESIDDRVEVYKLWRENCVEWNWPLLRIGECNRGSELQCVARPLIPIQMVGSKEGR